MDKLRTALHHIWKMDENKTSLLLLLLISVDYLFIILHLIYRIGEFDNPRLFRVDIDGSYPELFQYIKFFWIILLLIYTLGVTKIKGYLSWILIFLYFLLDDALQLHEDLGLNLSETADMSAAFGLRARDIGEIVVFAAFAVVLLVVLAWTYFRGPQIFRKVSNDLIILMGIFAFLVVFLDAFAAALDLGPVLYTAFVLLEDGGEMLITSVMVWYTYMLVLHKGEPPLYLHEAFTYPIAGGQP